MLLIKLLAIYPFKGTVSWDGRWGLLYINRKLFLRRIVADDKILIFLKGHFTIYIKQMRDSTAEWCGFNLSILKCRKIISSVILKSPAKTCVRESLASPIQAFHFNITQQITCSVRLNCTANPSVANFLVAYFSPTLQVCCGVMLIEEAGLG